MALNIQPLSDRVVVEPQAAETKTASKFSSQIRQRKTTTRNCSCCRQRQKDHEMTVAVGDTVLYGKYAGNELKLDGKDYLIMRRMIFWQSFNQKVNKNGKRHKI